MWEYQQGSGRVIASDGSNIGTGYSGGNVGQTPEGINNADMQNIQRVGPLPQGNYTIGQPINHPHLGPFAMPLTPNPANEMFGRGAFYIHGDNSAMNQSASEGCIILPHTVRVAIWNSGDHDLQVVA